jgi:hypothetical protein
MYFIVPVNQIKIVLNTDGTIYLFAITVEGGPRK